MDRVELVADQALKTMLDMGSSVANVVEWWADDLTPRMCDSRLRLRRTQGAFETVAPRSAVLVPMLSGGDTSTAKVNRDGVEQA